MPWDDTIRALASQAAGHELGGRELELADLEREIAEKLKSGGPGPAMFFAAEYERALVAFAGTPKAAAQLEASAHAGVGTGMGRDPCETDAGPVPPQHQALALSTQSHVAQEQAARVVRESPQLAVPARALPSYLQQAAGPPPPIHSALQPLTPPPSAHQFPATPQPAPPIFGSKKSDGAAIRATEMAPTALLPEGLPIPAHLRIQREPSAAPKSPPSVVIAEMQTPAVLSTREPFALGATKLAPHPSSVAKPLPFAAAPSAPSAPPVVVPKPSMPQMTMGPRVIESPVVPFRAAEANQLAPAQGTGTRWLDDPARGATVAPNQTGGPVLPFRGVLNEPVSREQVDLSMFPIERYADVVARLSRGEPREAVLRSAVLTDAMWAAVQRAWGQLLKDDKALAAHFNHLLQQGLGQRDPSR